MYQNDQNWPWHHLSWRNLVVLLLVGEQISKVVAGRLDKKLVADKVVFRVADDTQKRWQTAVVGVFGNVYKVSGWATSRHFLEETQHLNFWFKNDLSGSRTNFDFFDKTKQIKHYQIHVSFPKCTAKKWFSGKVLKCSVNHRKPLLLI